MIRAGAGLRGEKIEVLGGEAELEGAIERTGAAAVFLAMPSASSDPPYTAEVTQAGHRFFRLQALPCVVTMRFDRCAQAPTARPPLPAG